MIETLSLAIAQTCPRAGDVEANLDEHLRLAKRAANEGAEIVLFPELSLTGYELERGADLAFSEHDSRLAPLVEASAEQSIILIAGGPVRTMEGLFIGALVFLPNRTTQLYTKQHLGTFPATAIVDSLEGTIPPSETVHFQPGTDDPLICVGSSIAAVAICADIGQPSHAQNAASRQADHYLASMFVIPADFAGETAKLAHYAVQHRMTVLMSNFGGASGGLRSAGRSSIWSAEGRMLAQLDDSGSGIAVITHTGGDHRVRTLMFA